MADEDPSVEAHADARVRRVAVAALAIFTLVLASRMPFIAHTLWAHDSVLYADAIERGFHVDDELGTQRPHPPGYILYVGAAALARGAGLSSDHALVAISMLASAVAATALFLLARRFVEGRTAVIAALAYAAAPLVWQYGEIAYPYAVLSAAAIAAASALLAARERGTRDTAIAASVVFGLAAGFRQDLLPLLAPLWLWSLRPLAARHAVASGAALVLTCALWLIPTVILSGGIADYMEALLAQATYVSTSYSAFLQGWPALLVNGAMTAYSLWWALLLATPFAVAGALGVAARALRQSASMHDRFLIAWILPALVVYSTVHIGEFGYVLSIVPALYIVAAREVERLALRLPLLRHRVLAPVALAAPALVFMASSAPFSGHAIATHDAELTARFTYVREHYPAARTLILTREDYLLVRHYLPEYRARRYDPDPYVRLSLRVRASRVDRIIVFTPGLSPERANDVRRIACAKGIEFVYLDVVPGAVLELRGERYAVASPTP